MTRGISAPSPRAASSRPLPSGPWPTPWATTHRRSAHLVVAQVSSGPATVEVEILRKGSVRFQLQVEVADGAGRGPRAPLSLRSSSPGLRLHRPAPASVPSPEACRFFRDPPPTGVTTSPQSLSGDEHVEGRNVIGHRCGKDNVPDRAQNVIWYRFDQTPFRGPCTMTVAGRPGYMMPRRWARRLGVRMQLVTLTLHILDVLAHNQAAFRRRRIRLG